jgi:hypothetical protein
MRAGIKSGATNLISGMAESFRGSIPLIALISEVNSLIGGGETSAASRRRSDLACRWCHLSSCATGDARRR